MQTFSCIILKCYFFIHSAKILFVPLKCEIIMVISNCVFFPQYCDSFSVTFRYLSRNSNNYCCCNSWQSDNYMESNIEEKPWTQVQKRYKKLSKEVNSDNFCYRKVGRAISLWVAIEKSYILIGNQK